MQKNIKNLKKGINQLNRLNSIYLIIRDNMAVELVWKHQQKAYELVKKTLKEKKRASFVFPTGCGKSFVVLKYMEEKCINCSSF